MVISQLLTINRACQLSLDAWMLSTGAFPYATYRYAHPSTHETDILGVQHRQCNTSLTRLHAPARASTSQVHGTPNTAHVILPALITVGQTVFFGANDACLPGSATGQHVPLHEYRKNLRDILEHPSVVAQKPRLILLTPPPVNEYQLEEADLVKGNKDPLRSAEHTKEYADACRQVGAEVGVVVLDVWSVFMAKAGWREGEPLIGSKKLARNEVLEKLLVDGEFLVL